MRNARLSHGSRHAPYGAGLLVLRQYDAALATNHAASDKASEPMPVNTTASVAAP